MTKQTPPQITFTRFLDDAEVPGTITRFRFFIDSTLQNEALIIQVRGIAPIEDAHKFVQIWETIGQGDEHNSTELELEANGNFTISGTAHIVDCFVTHAEAIEARTDDTLPEPDPWPIDWSLVLGKKKFTLSHSGLA